MSGAIEFLRDGHFVNATVTDPASVLRQMLAVEDRGVAVLPAAWFEPGTAEAMADWIVRFQPQT